MNTHKKIFNDPPVVCSRCKVRCIPCGGSWDTKGKVYTSYRCERCGTITHDIAHEEIPSAGILGYSVTAVIKDEY